jgi:hypothetical protein
MEENDRTAAIAGLQVMQADAVGIDKTLRGRQSGLR